MLNLGDWGLSSIFRQFKLCLSWLIMIFSCHSGCSAEYNQIQEWVSAKSVGSMHRSNCSFTCSQQSRNDNFFSINYLGDFCFVIGRNSSHVVVDCRYNGNGFFGDVDVRENFGCFSDSGQSFVENSRIEMVEMQVNMILLWANSSSSEYLHSHCSADHISWCQVFSRRGISGHEPFT